MKIDLSGNVWIVSLHGFEKYNPSQNQYTLLPTIMNKPISEDLNHKIHQIVQSSDPIAGCPQHYRLGEFSLTDKRFSKINRFMASTLFDENFGGRWGNCHVALGASYADTYSGDVQSLNKEKKARLGFNDSALHWDIVNTENKRVTAHLKNGENKGRDNLFGPPFI